MKDLVKSEVIKISRPLSNINCLSRDGPLTVQNIADGASLKDTRASPKSQIFNLQSAFARMFFGFKSRWNTLAAILGDKEKVSSSTRKKPAKSTR